MGGIVEPALNALMWFTPVITRRVFSKASVLRALSFRRLCDHYGQEVNGALPVERVGERVRTIRGGHRLVPLT